MQIQSDNRLNTYKKWWEIAAIIIAMIGAVATFNAYIDWRIDQKLSDEALLKKIGASARPFCVFDNKGSIHFDSGAMQFIGYPGKPMVEFPILAKDGFPQEITVHFNRLFEYPPALTLIGGGLTTCAAKRGQGYDWTYTIYYAQALITDQSPTPPPSEEEDFKLEILF